MNIGKVTRWWKNLRATWDGDFALGTLSEDDITQDLFYHQR